jgi:phospholipid-binding lipoprotein MlaA
MSGLSWRKAGGGVLVAAMLSITACADYTNQQALSNPDADMDSGESINRVMFDIHTGIDKIALKPITDVYRFLVPDPGKRMVSNFVRNIGSPVTFFNSVMQGDQENTFATFWRFIINSTFGIGGLFDVASEAGLKNRQADFGQTMAVWGIDSGPYTFLPLFGPGTVRDTLGRIPDVLMDPLTWYYRSWPEYTEAGLAAVNARSSNYTVIQDTYRTSLDPYATFRSGYLQRRTSEINRAKRVHRPAASVDSMPPVKVKSKPE